MYYDVLLTFLPLCLLFSQPRRFLQVKFWRPPPQPLPAAVQEYYQPTLLKPAPLPFLPGGTHRRWVINPLPPLFLVLLLGVPPLLIWHDPGYHFPPVDTLCILAFWAWCGWAVWSKADDCQASRERKRPEEAADAAPVSPPVAYAGGSPGNRIVTP